MKNRILYGVFFSAVIATLWSCSDWNETTHKDFLDREPSEEYYENLRAWKSTFRDRQITFGWFGGWTGTGANMKGCLSGLPDSVDLVSIWGEWHPHTITPEKKADLEYAQKVKGLKVMACTFAEHVGDRMTPPEYDTDEATREAYWGWVDGDEAAIEASIRKYAKAIADSVYKSGLDGYDIDHEPNYGGAGKIASNMYHMHIFVEELGKYFGPKSGTGKILAIDGEPYELLPESGPYFDYFIVQAYNSTTYTNLNTRIGLCFDKYKDVMTPEETAAKYVATENFEDHASTGGPNHTTQFHGTVYSFLGMAYWEPTYNGKRYRKGGCGAYHMEYSFSVAGKSGFYPYYREAISVMNPPQENDKF